jgi:hypothetical protein
MLLPTLTRFAQQIAGQRIIAIWTVANANNLMLRAQIALKNRFAFDSFLREETISTAKLVGSSLDPMI